MRRRSHKTQKLAFGKGGLESRQSPQLPGTHLVESEMAPLYRLSMVHMSMGMVAPFPFFCLKLYSSTSCWLFSVFHLVLQDLLQVHLGTAVCVPMLLAI